MRVKSLSINNLRNIESTQISLDPCLNYFGGDNGAGKTSILEALAVLSKGRSFRAGQISALIGPQSKSFQLVSTINLQSGDAHQMGMERGADFWTARHNGEDVTQFSELTRLLPYVLLEPSSHTLISGPPDGRRKYLDWGVFHVKHDFLMLWRRYTRVLKQRNAALRLSNNEMVESLDPQFIELGEQLHQARRVHVDLLSQSLETKLPLFNQTLDGVGLSYRKGWSGEDLQEAIQLSRPRDFERGSTGPGPHKADLYLTLDGTPAKERLSRGEQKAMTSAMILTQAHLIADAGEKPVLLLDDLSSELDEGHLAKVLGAGVDLGAQIWMTGTGPAPFLEATEGSYKVFHVEHGRVASKDT